MTITLQADEEPPNDFNEILEDALIAFRSDVSYAESMIKRARAITHKREVGAVRRELRQAEKEARSKCQGAEPFRCYTEGACGTGDCKFAKPELAKLVIPTPKDAEKTRERPQDSEHGPYSLEESVLPLYEIRKSEG